MTFIAKALIGVTAVVIPSSIGVTVAYRDSLFGGSFRPSSGQVVNSETDLSDLKNRCYVIPTEEDNDKAKMLICKDKNSEDTGSGKYEYWYREEGGKKNTKVTKISKEGENLKITLENAGLPMTLVLKEEGKNWTSVADGTDLSNCELIEGEEGKLQCFGDGGSSEITLSKFLE